MHRILIIAIAVLALPAAAFAGSDADTIRAALDKWEAAYNSGDGAAVAALYTEDGAVFPPGGSRADGRAAIAEVWNGAIASGLSDVDLEAVEIDVKGDTAIEIGLFKGKVPAEGGGASDVAGKYIVVWKKGGDGGWLLHRDIWNAGQ